MKAVAAAFSFCVTGLILVGQVSAQARPATTSESSNIAVVDLRMIFKSHPRLVAETETVKAEVEAFEKTLGEERKQVGKMQEKMQTYAAGSPEFKAAEKEMAQKISDVQVQMQLKRKDLADREAKVLYDTYKDISAEITRRAEAYGITLVLSYDSEAIDPRDRNSVLGGLGRAVLYQRNLDLTPMLIKFYDPQGTNALRMATKPVIGGALAPGATQPGNGQGGRPLR